MAEPIENIIKQRYNVNPNVNVKTKSLNNVNVAASANKLVQSLSDPKSFEFYCKVCYALPEHVVWSNLEKALTGRRPAAYFTFLCKLEMERL